MGNVFVQTNEADGNRVIVFEGGDDGALTQLESVATGGKGDGVPHLTSQGSVLLAQDGHRLLVANAGSGDVSVLTVAETLSLEDYLVPPEGYLQRKGERDDRVIWRLVKRVAARSGVDAHVHALRGAFAAYYLSLHPGDVEALKELLGHRSIATTQVYLRKFDKATAMERVRSLSWDDVAKSGDGAATETSQSAAKVFESLAGVGAGGFEPP